jgi:hypothetical protein
VNAFFEATVVPPSGSDSVIGCSTSHTVVGEVAVHQVRVLDVIQMKSCGDVEAGRMAKNCFELERQAPRPMKPKKTHGLSLGSSKVRKMKKLGFLSFWRIFVKWIWAAVKPRGFRVKSKLKLVKACDVGRLKGQSWIPGQIFPIQILFSGFDPSFGPVLVSGFGFPPSGYVFGFISPPL